MEEELRMDKKSILNQINVIKYQLEKLEENINNQPDWYLNMGYDEEKLESSLFEIIQKLGEV
jgi:hypothetical protein